MQSKIKVGYFPDWSDDPTVLFSTERPALLGEFEHLLQNLADEKIREIAIHQLNFIEPHHHIKIIARLSEHDAGMQRLKDADSFVWATTCKYWKEFAAMLSVLRQGDETKGGHQYLDSSLTDDIQIIVSLNEYPADFWTKFG